MEQELRGQQLATSGASHLAGGVSSTDVKYGNWSDLVPDPSTKQTTPLEFVAWLDIFEFWVTAFFGSLKPDSRTLANELRVKLDADWTAILKSTLFDWRQQLMLTLLPPAKPSC